MKRTKKSNGTIKTYGDPNLVAALLGIDERKDATRVRVESKKEQEPNRDASQRDNAMIHDIGRVANAQEASSSDVESLVDSLCESDNFDSSDGMDSRACSPPLSSLKRDAQESLDPIGKPESVEEASDRMLEPEVEKVDAVSEQKEPHENSPPSEREATLQKRTKLVSGLSGIQELRYTLPSVLEVLPEVKKPRPYKPCTLTDYKRWKREQEEHKLGQLGFDRLNPEYQERVAKAARQREYSNSIRRHGIHIDVRHRRQVLALPVIPERSKREHALKYAKKQHQLPPPVKEQPRKTDNKTHKELSIVDIMKRRHAREKLLVDSLRNEVAALR